MTTPVNPNNGSNATPPAGASTPGSPPPGYAQSNPIDPGGVWLKFFQQIAPGQEIDPKMVRMFEMGVMKWFETIIAQENARMKKTYDEMRKVYEEG